MRKSARISVVAAVVAASGWIVGCSSSESPPGAPPTDPGSSSGSFGGTSSSSGGSSGSPSGHTPSPSGDGGAGSSGGGGTVADCVAACEAQHPHGAQLGHAIDTCWSQRCDPSCTTMEPTGKLFGPSHGSCATDVSTPAADCSQCTVDHCCKAWDACFEDADCLALNACSNACYGK